MGRRALLGLVISTLLLVASCGGGAQGSSQSGTEEPAAGVSTNEYGGQKLELAAPRHGGGLRFGLQVPIETLDPAEAVGASKITVLQQIFGRLMKHDPQGRTVPAMAESFETVDNKTWTLKLPAGVTFHDGTPFNADAVIEHVERVGAPGSNSLSAAEARSVQSMTALDELTVKFVLKEPSSIFSSAFAQGSLAFVPSPTAVAAKGSKFGLAPVGAGPFKVDSFSPGGNVELSRFEQYYRPDLPYLDTLTFVSAPEGYTRLSALTTGELDASAVKTWSQIKKARGADVTILEQPGYMYTSLLLNLKDGPLADVRIRRALNYAVDREALSSALSDGHQLPMRGVLSPVHPHYKETGWPDSDMAAARALMGEYEAESGAQLAFEMLIPQGAQFASMAAILQQMFKDAGIEVNYRAASPPSIIVAASSADYDIIMWDPAVLPETFREISSKLSSRASANLSWATDAEVDRILDEARATNDPDVRNQLIGPLQEALAAWVPYVPLLAGSPAFLLGEDVIGFPGAIPSASHEVFDARYVWVKE